MFIICFEKIISISHFLGKDFSHSGERNIHRFLFKISAILERGTFLVFFTKISTIVERGTFLIFFTNISAILKRGTFLVFFAKISAILKRGTFPVFFRKISEKGTFLNLCLEGRHFSSKFCYFD